MKTLRYTLCDVFTDRPLAGNPLAVFTDARSLDTATMQALARYWETEHDWRAWLRLGLVYDASGDRRRARAAVRRAIALARD